MERSSKKRFHNDIKTRMFSMQHSENINNMTEGTFLDVPALWYITNIIPEML